MGQGFQLKQGLPCTFNFSEHATAGSFEAGDPVEIDVSNGKVRIAQSDQLIWGIAQKDATGTVDTEIPVCIIDPLQVWVAWTDATVGIDDIGNDYGLNIAAGTTTVDLGDESTVTVTILNIDERHLVETTARVLVRFHSATICQSINAA